MLKINEKLQNIHYQPKPLDDSLSVYVYTDFISKLDSDNRIFLQSDIDALNKYKFTIDNLIEAGDCSFIENAFEIYSKSIKRYDEVITEIAKLPVEKSSTEYMQFSKKAYPYLSSEKDLIESYKKRILFTTLSDIAGLSKNKDSLQQNFELLFPKYHAKTLEKYSCKYASLNYTKSEFYSIFYNCFCNYFDPHTEYFSQNEKSSFLSGVSADNLTFGMYVSINEKDELVVDAVIPQSSAFMTGKIDTGDQILKINSLGKIFEISCTTIKKVAEIITSNDYKNIEVTLRKKTGEIYVVNLKKTVMKDDEISIYSYIIEKNNKKIGYIKIPSFYAVFESGKTNVSDDIAKEIKKLNKDGIDGLVLDLQNNGGGSMDEAIKLSGMFIKKGPIAVLKNRFNFLNIINDPSNKEIYTGKLAVVLNGFSASASEFFTNVMQDYNRAIIVGTNSFGKATMQRIFPLENNKYQTDFLKITIEKFYKITGQSNQYEGIKPDVETPTLFNNQMPRENDEKTALKTDFINTNIKLNAFDKTPIDKIKTKYNLEIKNDEKTLEINKLNVQIDALYDNDLPPILLNFANVFDQINDVNLLWKKIEDFNSIPNKINVYQNSSDKKSKPNTEFLNTNNTKKIEAIKTDFSVFEAVKILSD